MRLHVEYQRFFTELSERPGRDLAISAQRVPRAACIWRMMASSSGVHAPFLSVGSRLLHQRSRHCLPVRPGSMEAMRAHCLPPKRLTSSVSWASSVADHGPLTQSGCVSFCQRWMHCTSLRPSNALATSAQLEMACSFPCSFSHEVLSPCAFGEAGSDVSPMLSRSIPERAGGRHAASRLRRSSSDRFQAVATLTLDGAITPPGARVPCLQGVSGRGEGHRVCRLCRMAAASSSCCMSTTEACASMSMAKCCVRRERRAEAVGEEMGERGRVGWGERRGSLHR
mmetsp:Transcript_3843/g.11857  ORF Transcript_3843/g.11857 Transcript_3843/m.11857 type:complete len:283 (-) Transcript_3843:30-878(-)